MIGDTSLFCTISDDCTLLRECNSSTLILSASPLKTHLCPGSVCAVADRV